MMNKYFLRIFVGAGGLLLIVALAAATSSGQPVLIQAADEISLWALSTNELQLMGADGYEYVVPGHGFPVAACGIGG